MYETNKQPNSSKDTCCCREKTGPYTYIYIYIYIYITQRVADPKTALQHSWRNGCNVIFVTYRNITVWILVGNGINFSIAALAYLGYLCQASCNFVCNEGGERVSPYTPCQTLAPFMGNSTNHWCQKQHYNCKFSQEIHCYHLYHVKIRLPDINTPILKVSGGASRAQHRLTTGIVRRSYPSLRVIT